MKRNVINIALEKTAKYIILLIILSMVISYITLQVSINIKYAIDGILCNNYEMIPNHIRTILNNNYVHDLLIFAVIIIALNFIYVLSNYIRDRATTKFKLKINTNLKVALYKHVLNLEYKDYNSCNKAEILQRINEDSEVYSKFFNSQFNLILDILFLGIFVIRESIVLNLAISIYIIITIVAMLLFSLWYLKRINKQIEELIFKRKKLLNTTLINVNNFKLTRMFNKQKEESKRYKELNDDYTKEDIKLIKLILFYEILSDHITYLKEPIIYIIGGISIIRWKNDYWCTNRNT